MGLQRGERNPKIKLRLHLSFWNMSPKIQHRLTWTPSCLQQRLKWTDAKNRANDADWRPTPSLLNGVLEDSSAAPAGNLRTTPPVVATELTPCHTNCKKK